MKQLYSATFRLLHSAHFYSMRVQLIAFSQKDFSERLTGLSFGSAKHRHLIGDDKRTTKMAETTVPAGDLEEAENERIIRECFERCYLD